MELNKLEPKLDKRRIAKNTGVLYIRMLVMMIISLFTSRITLEALGVDDFGVFNVVGGTIGMLSILTSGLSTAISRYTTFELGKNDPQLKLIFCSSLTIQILFSIAVIILAETVGLWFVNNELNIPAASMYDANIVYQVSILTFVIALIQVPYGAQIIAHERMSFYAYMSILSVVGKLGVTYLIMVLPDNRLMWFSISWGLIAIMDYMITRWYCHKHFQETRFRFMWNKKLLKEMFGFAGWNVIGSTAAILRDQGGNIIINIFFGPAVNAARGIATQVSTQVQQFSGNFTQALNPQITKSYAMGEVGYTNSLVSQGARFSFYLMFMIAFPILMNTAYILKIWLPEVPEDAVVFVQLVLIFGLIETMSRPLITLMLATGNIMWYQIVVGGLQLLNVPISYLWLRLGGSPASVLIVAIGTGVICLIARLIMLNRMIGFNIRAYVNNACIKILIVAILSLPVGFVLSLYPADNFVQLMIYGGTEAVTVGVIALYFGCNVSERNKIINKIKAIISRFIPERVLKTQ